MRLARCCSWCLVFPVARAVGLLTELPDWRDTSVGGTRIRVALWLLETVGEGNVFTKSDLRAAFPGVEQIDRRMRDLREEGWVIATSREDGELSTNELKLASVGERVWERRGPRPGVTGRTDKQRRDALAASGYCCQDCGAAAGDAYPDAPHRIARLSVAPAGDALGDTLIGIVRCDRCNSSDPRPVGSADRHAIERGVEALTETERARLSAWLEGGRRTYDGAEQLWIRLRGLGETAATCALEALHVADRKSGGSGP